MSWYSTAGKDQFYSKI